MKEINKIFKITFKKYKLAIGLLFILSLFFQINVFNQNMLYGYSHIAFDIAHVDDYAKINSREDEENFWNRTYHDGDSRKTKDVFAERNGEKFKKEEVEKLSNYIKKKSSLNNPNSIDGSSYMKNDSTLLAYFTSKSIDTDKNMFKTDELITENFIPFFFFAIVVAFFLSSDYVTNFYKFMRQLPVKRENIYITKFFIGLGVTIFYYLVIILSKYLIIRNSYMSDLASYDNLLNIVFSDIIRICLVYSAAIGLGTISGNVIGFVGMLIITFLFSYLVELNLSAFEYLTKISNIVSGYEHFMKSLPNIIEFPLNLIEFLNNGTNYNLISLGFTIVYFLIGYIITKIYDGSRITKCIVFKNISNIIKYFAITTTTSAFILLSATLFDNSMIIYPFVIVFLFIAYKFHNMLFERSII